jgi:hypothetical protein
MLYVYVYSQEGVKATIERTILHEIYKFYYITGGIGSLVTTKEYLLANRRNFLATPSLTDVQGVASGAASEERGYVFRQTTDDRMTIGMHDWHAWIGMHELAWIWQPALKPRARTKAENGRGKERVLFAIERSIKAG